MSLTSKGSFRSMGSLKEKETPEERYKRLEHKYGKALHDAIAKIDQLRKEKKVNNWMEVFVLLNEQEPKPITPIKNVRTPNGILDPLTAAGILKDPVEQFVKKDAAQHIELHSRKDVDSAEHSPPALPARKTELTISKEDRDRVDKWLVEEIANQQKKLDELPSEGKAAKDQRKKVQNLQRQVDDLRAFDTVAQGKTVTINFTAESIFDQRVKRETIVAGMVALASFFLMFLIMYFFE